MPVRLAYKDLNNKNLVSAVKKLAFHTGFRSPLTHHVAKFLRKWDEESKMAQQAFLEIMNKYAKKDEKGNFIPGSDGPFSFEEDVKEAFTKECEAFDAKEFTIEVHKFRMDQMDDVGISPVELIAMEPLLTEIASVESATA